MGVVPAEALAFVHGAHLMLSASEDFKATTMAVPSLPLSADKMALRRKAREERRAFVTALTEAKRDELEAALADHLRPHLKQARLVGAYSPLHDEISPLPAVAMAREHGATIAFPTFSDHQSPFRFLTGEPIEVGPFGIMQPVRESKEIFPDLILVPLVAIDAKGNRLGQGKGHYDRVLPELKRNGALLIGIGWAVQRLGILLEPEPWDVTMDGFASPEGLEMVR